MSLFFTRYSRCPWCGKKAAAGLKKNRAAAWHMGISLRELQKRLLNRQGAFLSFNNASACRSLFVRSLCGLSSSSSLIAQYPYPCFHPFFGTQILPAIQKDSFLRYIGRRPKLLYRAFAGGKCGGTD